MRPEQKRGQSSEKPQVFYSNGTSIDIINLKTRKKISIRMSGGVSTTMIEDLGLGDANQSKLEKNQLMKTTRELISAKLDTEAVALLPGSEIEPEMRADELEGEFGSEVKNLRKMGLGKDKIEEIVKEQGKLFSTGKTVVDGIVADLNSRIDDYFQRTDEAAKNKSPRD